jgi:arsenate reductase (thioredoxin)
MHRRVPANRPMIYLCATMLHTRIQQFCETAVTGFDHISTERKAILAKIAQYITAKVQSGASVHLMYVCTHNSRRSHFGQVWGAVAAYYYGIPQVSTYSGGTEATAFNPNAIAALQRLGFEVTATTDGTNPVYEVRFAEDGHTTCFSKTYDDAANPSTGFAAIMTCGDAEANCPFIPGVELRIATTYNDPKAADGTPEAAATYDARCAQIATEVLYCFSLV